MNRREVLQALDSVREMSDHEVTINAQFIRDHNGPEVLIYADPPYVMNVRTLNGDQYRYEMSDSDHIKLLDTLKCHTGMVLLSGYDCELYRDMLSEWRMEAIGTYAERGARRTECLWFNPQAAQRCAQIRMDLQGV